MLQVGVGEVEHDVPSGVLGAHQLGDLDPGHGDDDEEEDDGEAAASTKRRCSTTACGSSRR